MTTNLKLLCVFAHPDDESLGNGGILAKYAAEGIETYLVVATRGERGWWGNEEEYPGLEAFGKRREAEVLAAAKVLGLRRVEFLQGMRKSSFRGVRSWVAHPNHLTISYYI